MLTAHSGLVNSPLFTELHQLELGDIFTITVLDEKLYYEVNQILTVEPDEIDAVRQVSGRDYVTLITCTPIGVNTHRLLVRGERIAAPTDAPRDRALAGDAVHTGFPWWALGFVAGSGAAVIFTRPKAGVQGK